jgi:ferritin-like metal-binding protein YciE
VLDMLGNLEEEAQRSELKQQLRHHAGETRQQIDNIEQVFRALGEEPDDSPCLVTKALDKQAKADIKMADNELVDAVILSGAAETEHHEIAVYESLLAEAEDFRNEEITRLLRQNLEIEQHTLEEVKQQQRQVVTAAA